MSVINTNTASMRAANASANASKMLSTSMERLSTGKRINSAKDDAAGLAISTAMTSQVRGMNQSIRNANDGISLAQTAEGALNEVTNLLQRVRELAVQSASGTYSNEDRTNMQAEVTQLTAQIGDVLKTEFNDNALFTNAAPTDANKKSFAIQVGANASETVNIDIKAINLTAITGAPASADYVAGTPASADYTPGTPANDGPDGVAGNADDVAAVPGTGTAAVPGAGTAATAGLSIATSASATTALGTLDTALKAVATTRADLGASQSRLESVVNTLTSNVTNLSDARSRIEDTDYSTETAALAKAQILSQASTAMLSQANQSQQNVLSLLR
jgi:flagellin